MKKVLTKSLSILTAVIMLFCLLPFGALAEGDIPIDEEHFPDAAFRSYVSSNCDTDGNGLLSQEETAAVTSISVAWNTSITDLTGIAYFTSLTELKCQSCKLTALDVSQNTALTVLLCNKNKITALDVSQNTALTKLWCDGNKLTELDVSQNTALKEFKCSDNQLQSLNVSNLTAVTDFRCGNNQLTTLDVSDLTALKQFECYNNQLTALDVTNNTALTRLSCGKNQLTSLDLSVHSPTLNLACENNSYTVSSNPFDLTTLPGNFDVSKASNWQGGTVNGTMLTFSQDSTAVSYTYNCGSNHSVGFVLLPPEIQGNPELDAALNIDGGTLQFVSAGVYPWAVADDAAESGRVYAKSTNEGIPSSSSTVSTAVTAVEGDILQFDFQCWGEGPASAIHYDKLQLKIDDAVIIDWGAEPKEWTTYATNLDAGEHTIEWTYIKDQITDKEGDHAFLDNVYVGQPVLPTSITVEDLTVHGNRHAQLVWEVLPVYTFNKDVTFEIADTSVAVIDETGFVEGIGIGQTTVTVRSAADPTVSGSATITVPDLLPIVDLNKALNVAGGTLIFNTEGEYPWVVVDDTAGSGRVYAKSTGEGVLPSDSGPITSTVSMNVTANEGEILQFDFQCWGAGTPDPDDYNTYWITLNLIIDGVKIISWGEGPHEWSLYAVALTAGEHTVEWTYEKTTNWYNEGDHAFLDNVYVGAPSLPEEIQVDPVEIHEGLSASATYTVLPPEAFDKSVTFSTADATIATVDEDGVVTGVAEGTTTLTVTSVADPTVFGTAPITVLEPIPVVWLNGYMAFNPGGAPNIWGRFADCDSSVIENMGPMDRTYAGAFAGGKVYGYYYNDAPGNFYIMDPFNNYTVSDTGVNPGKIVRAMAYNHANDKMYAFCDSGTVPNGYALYTVNLATGMLDYVAELSANGNLIMTLAIDTEGNAYGCSYADENINGNISDLYSINLETGVCTLIGSTGLGLAYVQSMTWDHNTDKLYWAQYDHQMHNGLYTLDVTTGEATRIGAIGIAAEVTCLFTIDDIPIPPVTMPDCSITFMDGYTGEEIPGGYIVPGGSMLDPDDFPVPPEHEGVEFTGWDYDGHLIYQDTVVTAIYHDPNVIGFYFETEPQNEGWTWEDADGDGFNWQWSLEDPSKNYSAPEGEGCMISFSYDNPSHTPLHPDNWLISPEVPGGGTVSFKICAQDENYPDEHIGVYASTDGGETWSDELGYFVPKTPSPVFIFSVDLADFAGMNIKLAFRHYNSSDAFCVNLDAVEITPSVPEPPTEEPPTAEPPTEEPPTEEPPTEEPPTEEPPTEEPPTEEPPTAEPEPQEGDVIFDIRNPETADGLYYAQPGETVTVEFTVAGEYAAHGLTVNFNYDPELLTIESLEEGAAMAEIRQVALPVLDYETIPGSICLGIMAPTDPFSAQGVIYTVSFKVAETAELGAVLPLEIEVADFFNMPVGEEATPIAWFAYNSGIVIGDAPVLPTEPPTEEPPTEEPPTEEPPTEEPPTEEPPTEEPTPPPHTGFISLAGAGIAAILAGAGVVLFRRKRR